MSLIDELKRRNVFKVGAAYLVVAWLAVQAASIALPAFDAPVWALRVFILVALLGFPLSVALAWAFETTPGGVRLDTSTAGSKRVLAVAAALVLLAFGWYFLGQPSFRRGDVAAPAAKPADAAPAPAKSLAVLPFVDMSAQHDQEYFSDGIAEELLNRLAQSADLRVAARTSAFQFKGRNLDIADIGRQLHVAHVLEGSVRKDGARIRVTAQLIDAASGFHLWSQTFERDTADVFKVQDEIAGAISGALEARLGARAAAPGGEHAVDPAAYDDYLQGRRYAGLRIGDNLRLAAEAFERAQKKDPGYAPAYSGRAFALVVGLGWQPWLSEAQAFAAASADLDKALELDPGNAEAHLVRAIMLSSRLQTEAARSEFERASALAPGSVDVMNFFGDHFEYTGNLRRAEALKRQAMALDPLSFVHAMNLASIFNDGGRHAEAVAMAERAVSQSPEPLSYEQLFQARLRLRQFDAAQAALGNLCRLVGADDPLCLVRSATLRSATGHRDEALSLLGRAEKLTTPLWGNYPPYSALAQAYADIGEFRKAAAQVRASFGIVAWAPTLPLLWADGGAKLPEEISPDPDWLAAWNDPHARELMAAYRTNTAERRKPD